MAKDLNPPNPPPLLEMLRAPVTIPMVFVQGMLSGAQARGQSCEALLAGAGIAPELLAQAGARHLGPVRGAVPPADGSAG
ncbi:hypothetical protein ACIPRI_16385 [Variovorax sp. LARHSF232]